jgi:hypothetical protein
VNMRIAVLVRNTPYDVGVGHFAAYKLRDIKFSYMSLHMLENSVRGMKIRLARMVFCYAATRSRYFFCASFIRSLRGISG